MQLDPERNVPGRCAKLVYTLYGLRTAASSWEKECTGTLVQAGFEAGKATSCTFFHSDRDVRSVVNGDDAGIGADEGDVDDV